MAKRKVGGGDFPDNAWKPEPGDRLIGKVLRKEEVRTQYGQCGVLEVDDETNGVTTIFCGSVVLERIYDDVNEGDVLDIAYEGVRMSEKSGREFKSYYAEVDDGGI